MKNQNNSLLSFGYGKDTKKEYAKKLFKALSTPQSRRMAATQLGFIDQTYMVTPHILKWIKQGKAQVIGVIRCSRSGRKVEKITTNPELFISSSTNQLNLFD